MSDSNPADPSARASMEASRDNVLELQLLPHLTPAQRAAERARKREQQTAERARKRAEAKEVRRRFQEEHPELARKMAEAARAAELANFFDRHRAHHERPGREDLTQFLAIVLACLFVAGISLVFLFADHLS